MPDTTAVDSLPQPVFDSVIVYHEFANTPFHAEDNFFYFEEIRNQRDSAILKIVPHQYDKFVIDLITTIYWGRSSMSKLKNEFICCDLMESVYIEDDRLKLRNGIGVGDSAHAVFSSFDLEFDPAKNYSFIQMEAGEATNFLIIVFTNNVVSRIFILAVYRLRICGTCGNEKANRKVHKEDTKYTAKMLMGAATGHCRYLVLSLTILQELSAVEQNSETS